MSDTTDHNGLSGDDLLAAEVALGVLADAERADAVARIARDRVFARLVAQWEERLAPWAGQIQPIVPPPAVWDRIAATLPAERTQTTGFLQSLAFWRGLTLATGTLAAACLAALIYLNLATPGSTLVAGLDGGGHRHFVATVDVARGSIAVVPAAFSADATRVPELWLIPADGKPRPLGLLRADSTVVITIPAALSGLTTGQATLAVSLEPPGGSPTGQPTGPVVAAGKLTSL